MLPLNELGLYTHGKYAILVIINLKSCKSYGFEPEIPGMEEDIEMYQEDLVNVESEYEDSKRRWEEIEIEAQRENRFSHQLFDVVLG